MKWSRLTKWLTTLTLALLATGCHELQPHRLQQLNRGPGLSPQAYYSVADPDLPEAEVNPSSEQSADRRPAF